MSYSLDALDRFDFITARLTKLQSGQAGEEVVGKMNPTHSLAVPWTDQQRILCIRVKDATDLPMGIFFRSEPCFRLELQVISPSETSLLHQWQVQRTSTQIRTLFNQLREGAASSHDGSIVPLLPDDDRDLTKEKAEDWLISICSLFANSREVLGFLCCVDR